MQTDTVRQTDRPDPSHKKTLLNPIRDCLNETHLQPSKATASLLYRRWHWWWVLYLKSCRRGVQTSWRSLRMGCMRERVSLLAFCSVWVIQSSRLWRRSCEAPRIISISFWWYEDAIIMSHDVNIILYSLITAVCCISLLMYHSCCSPE